MDVKTSRQLRFPPFRLDPDNACLWRATKAIRLTPKAVASGSWGGVRVWQITSSVELTARLTSPSAVNCSTDWVSSPVRACSSLKRRTFSMAMTAWSAKVFSSSISVLENGLGNQHATHTCFADVHGAFPVLPSGARCGLEPRQDYRDPARRQRLQISALPKVTPRDCRTVVPGREMAFVLIRPGPPADCRRRCVWPSMPLT
jgi:hypothetical protein